jgi:hypothetical protein
MTKAKYSLIYTTELVFFTLSTGQKHTNLYPY